MRLVMTRRLELGTVLATDVLTGRHGTPLLRKGTRLTASYRDALVRAGINAVYVDDAFYVSTSTKQRSNPFYNLELDQVGTVHANLGRVHHYR